MSMVFLSICEPSVSASAIRLSTRRGFPLEWLCTAQSAALSMETAIQELAERTAEKLKKLTEEEFAGLVFLPAEDME